MQIYADGYANMQIYYMSARIPRIYMHTHKPTYKHEYANKHAYVKPAHADSLYACVQIYMHIYA